MKNAKLEIKSLLKLLLLLRTPKSFSELRGILSRPTISKRLKYLQKKGIVYRDIDTRKYTINESKIIEFESLLFQVRDLIKKLEV